MLCRNGAGVAPARTASTAPSVTTGAGSGWWCSGDQQAREHADQLPNTATIGDTAPALPGMSTWDLVCADLWATGISPDTHAIELVRDHLATLDAIPIAALAHTAHGTPRPRRRRPHPPPTPTQCRRHHLPQHRGRDRPSSRRAVWSAEASEPRAPPLGHLLDVTSDGFGSPRSRGTVAPPAAVSA